jgi:hypothetical protein
MRKVTRDLNEDVRDSIRALANTDAFPQSRRERKKVEMRFAHMKRVLRLDRLQLRSLSGARDEVLLTAPRRIGDGSSSSSAALHPSQPLASVGGTSTRQARNSLTRERDKGPAKTLDRAPSTKPSSFATRCPRKQTSSDQSVRSGS